MIHLTQDGDATHPSSFLCLGPVSLPTLGPETPGLVEMASPRPVGVFVEERKQTLVPVITVDGITQVCVLHKKVPVPCVYHE